jgi:hypothetical protein
MLELVNDSEVIVEVRHFNVNTTYFWTLFFQLDLL